MTWQPAISQPVASESAADAPPRPVPILLYHAVTETPGEVIAPFAVTPDEFRRQLDAVLDSGRTALTFGDLLRDDGVDPGRSVVVTFDDGYADFAASALPALQERSLPSTLYVTTGWMTGRTPPEPGPTDRMLAWSQLPELVEAGVELGAHSHSHPQMDTLSDAALREELVRSKDSMEQVLGRPVDTFAYPHGYNGPRVRRATRATGYSSAAGVRNMLHRPGEDRFNVARLTVTRTTTASDVARWLAGVDVPVAGPGESLPTRGWRMYRRSRAILRRAPGSAYRR